MNINQELQPRSDGLPFPDQAEFGHPSSQSSSTYPMVFSKTAAIHLRSLATRHDGIYAGYGQGTTVVTNNVKNFSNVPGLKVELCK